MKTISLFNHKGGVSKTTTTFGLGWMLTENDFEKKVLMVDLDSQCNLSGVVLGEGELAKVYGDSKYLKLSDIKKEATVKRDIKSLLEKEIVKTKQNNLYLIPGELDITEMDREVLLAITNTRSNKATIFTFLKAIKEIAEKNNIDYVLYDLSPSIGGLNEIMLMSSDYFIVPTNPDFFCYQAVKSLLETIIKWHKEIEQLNENSKGESSINNKPCYLGNIQQRFKITNGKATKTYQEWIDKIGIEINDTFIPGLKKLDNKLVSDFSLIDKISGEAQEHDLVYLSDFNTLQAVSHLANKPGYAITNDDEKELRKKEYDITETKENIKNNYRELYEDLARKILILIENNKE